MEWWFSLVPVTQYHPAREVLGVGLAEKCRALSALYIWQIYNFAVHRLVDGLGKFWPVREINPWTKRSIVTPFGADRATPFGVRRGSRYSFWSLARSVVDQT
jgi:hypothetical protein